MNAADRYFETINWAWRNGGENISAAAAELQQIYAKFCSKLYKTRPKSMEELVERIDAYFSDYEESDEFATIPTDVWGLSPDSEHQFSTSSAMDIAGYYENY